MQIRFGWTVTRNAPPASAHGDPDCHASRSVELSQTSRDQLLDVVKVCCTGYSLPSQPSALASRRLKL